jgi:hypothetical protein
MVKTWFESLDFTIKVDIRYTNNGGKIKPYLSAFFVSVGAFYPRFEEAMFVVYPQKGELELLYANRENYVIAKAPIKYNGLIPDFSSITKALDHMDLPKYAKLVLKLVVGNIYVNSDPLKFLPALKVDQDDIQDNVTPDSILPKIKQTIYIRGNLIDKGDRKYLGKVYFRDYFAINGKTEYSDIYDYSAEEDENEKEYYVSKGSFVVQKSSDGHLTAVESTDEESVFNPTYQEMLNILVPTEEEFEDFVQFVKDTIKESEVEYGDKNIVYY